MLEATPAASCANCDARLDGPYCSQCGQEAEGPLRPFWEALGEGTAEVLHLDSRVPHTLRLLARPGEATKQYVAGRRAPQVPPLKIYLFTSFVMFLVVGALHLRLVEVRTTANPDAPHIAPASITITPGTAGNPRVDRIARALAADPERSAARLTAALHSALFLLVPVFAALLLLVYRNRGRLYAEHLVFALHVHVVGFAALLAGLLLFRFGGSAVPLAVLRVAFLVYVALAMRTVYGGRWSRLVPRLVALALGYSLLFGATVAALALLVGAGVLGGGHAG